MLYDDTHNSWIHGANPALKLGLMLAGVVTILVAHNINVMALIAGFLFVLLVLGSGQPSKRLGLFLLPFLFVFVSTGVSMILFGQGETLWWQWGPISITRESFYRGLHVGFRALSFGLMGLFFAFTTSPVLLFYSLMQQLKLPPRYAYSFMASLRMLPLIFQEFNTLKKTYKARGLQFSNGWNGLRQRLRMYAVPLLAQSIRRAQRIAVAMEARRFQSAVKRTYYYQTGFSASDALLTLCWIALFVGAWIIGWQWPFVNITDVRF